MVDRVVLSRQAQKDLRAVPAHVQSKLKEWVASVETFGLPATRARPGWHDEPLAGKAAGARSIRLSQGYRAYYETKASGQSRLLTVTGVDKHVYRLRRK